MTEETKASSEVTITKPAYEHSIPFTAGSLEMLKCFFQAFKSRKGKPSGEYKNYLPASCSHVTALVNAAYAFTENVTYTINDGRPECMEFPKIDSELSNAFVRILEAVMESRVVLCIKVSHCIDTDLAVEASLTEVPQNLDESGEQIRFNFIIDGGYNDTDIDFWRRILGRKDEDRSRFDIFDETVGHGQVWGLYRYYYAISSACPGEPDPHGELGDDSRTARVTPYRFDKNPTGSSFARCAKILDEILLVYSVFASPSREELQKTKDLLAGQFEKLYAIKDNNYDNPATITITDCREFN